MIRLKRNSAQRIEGIGEDLPEGEVVLWQGAPQFWPLLKQAFHFRLLVVYFAILLAWRLIAGAQEGALIAPLVTTTLALVPLAGAALAMLALLAWLSCKTTIYAITSRRVVMRIGIALSVTFNLPLKQIDSASVKRGKEPDGVGDLCLGLGDNAHIAYLNLWPHAKPWALRSPEPMMRSIAKVDEVAVILAQALAAQSEQAPAPAGSAPTVVESTSRAGEAYLQPASVTA